MVFHSHGPGVVPFDTAEGLTALFNEGVPLWVRVNGLGDPQHVQAVLEPLQIPPDLLPLMLELPQHATAMSMSESPSAYSSMLAL